ncbi:glycosyltransferase family 1 protein [Pedobacter frigidisoli]|uniref:Glycosyltransferase family 1 protein n=1 Tax=Pedobacter frigidisoli TaxID=2530455 RepID=A0A4R0NRI6_9SPHI|nr:glycosyltransferase family 1 protein [Pedobacter frigidisoli]TCD01965.1 glycosyltransferase family 1 protein [Pedobacter frigidisoli]
MNILADSRWMGNTGIGRVYAELISRVPEELSIVGIDNSFPLGNPLSPMFLTREIASRSKLDAFYSPSYMPPLYSKVPFVITIHDLNHLYFYSAFHKFYLKNIIGSLAKKASKVITVSNFTKRELVEKLELDANKIEVIYNGVDGAFINNQESYNLAKPYFLYVGNRRSYKNLVRTIEAFAIAKISNDFIFAITGTEDLLLKETINRLGLEKRVVFLGFISEADLPKLYRGAYALLFVSLMEGFGLPILESMASGTPVLTSNVSSLPEIGGDAVLVVDPYSVSEIVSGIETLVDKGDLYFKLVQKGYERVKTFDWAVTANKTWNVIKNQ